MSIFQPGDRVQLTDAKDRKFTVVLQKHDRFHTHKGIIEHDDLIGQSEGTVVTSTSGYSYLALRPLLIDYILSMPRGAAIIYPKDCAQIITEGDIFPGAKVLEAGAGSGSLTCSLLRAVGNEGKVISLEIREDHAEFAQKNVEKFFGTSPKTWSLLVADVTDPQNLSAQTHPELEAHSFDRVVLDMLDPDHALDTVGQYLKPGGVLICYVATVTQLSKLAEAIKEHGQWSTPRSWESLVREWHVEGLAVRPNHRMQAHTAFLLSTRKLAPGVEAPQKYLHSSKRHRMQLKERQLREEQQNKTHVLDTPPSDKASGAIE